MFTLPLAIVGAYLAASRTYRWNIGALDLASIAIAVAVGVALIWRLPAGSTLKTIVTGLYIPAEAVGLVAFSLDFVCRVFGDCL